MAAQSSTRRGAGATPAGAGTSGSVSDGKPGSVSGSAPDDRGSPVPRGGSNLSCYEASANELATLGMTDTPEGQAVLALARSIDRVGTSGRAAMALPAMVTVLSQRLEVLRRLAPHSGSALDELRTKRDHRRAG